MGRDSGNSAEEGASDLSETTTPVSSGMHFFLQTVQVVVSRPAEGSTRGLHIQAVFDYWSAAVIHYPEGCECQDREARNCNIWRPETRVRSG